MLTDRRPPLQIEHQHLRFDSMFDCNDINYSQESVSSDYGAFNNDLYKPILVVKFPIAENAYVYTSHDNRRLLCAKNHSRLNNLRPFDIDIEMHDCEETIDPERLEVLEGWWTYFLAFPISYLDQSNPGLLLLSFVPRTYGALVTVRCALQAQTFPLVGRAAPDPKCPPEHREADMSVKYEKQRTKKIFNISEAYQRLEEYLVAAFENRGNCRLLLARGEPGQKFLHPEFPEYLRGSCEERISIVSATFCPTAFLKGAAEFDDEDRWLDREAADFDRRYQWDVSCAERDAADGGDELAPALAGGVALSGGTVGPARKASATEDEPPLLRTTVSAVLASFDGLIEKEKIIPGFVTTRIGKSGRLVFDKLRGCFSRLVRVKDRAITGQVESLIAMFEQIYPNEAAEIVSLLEGDANVAVLLAQTILENMGESSTLVEEIFRVSVTRIPVFPPPAHSPDVSEVHVHVFRCKFGDLHAASLCAAASKVLKMMRKCVWGRRERLMVMSVTAEQDIHLPRVFKSFSPVNASKCDKLCSDLRTLPALCSLFSTPSTIGPRRSPGADLLFLFSFGAEVHSLARTELVAFLDKRGVKVTTMVADFVSVV